MVHDTTTLAGLLEQQLGAPAGPPTPKPWNPGMQLLTRWRNAAAGLLPPRLRVTRDGGKQPWKQGHLQCMQEPACPPAPGFGWLLGDFLLLFFSRPWLPPVLARQRRWTPQRRCMLWLPGGRPRSAQHTPCGSATEPWKHCLGTCPCTPGPGCISSPTPARMLHLSPCPPTAATAPVPAGPGPGPGEPAGEPGSFWGTPAAHSQQHVRPQRWTLVLLACSAPSCDPGFTPPLPYPWAVVCSRVRLCLPSSKA